MRHAYGEMHSVAPRREKIIEKKQTDFLLTWKHWKLSVIWCRSFILEVKKDVTLRDFQCRAVHVLMLMTDDGWCGLSLNVSVEVPLSNVFSLVGLMKHTVWSISLCSSQHYNDSMSVTSAVATEITLKHSREPHLSLHMSNVHQGKKLFMFTLQSHLRPLTDCSRMIPNDSPNNLNDLIFLLCSQWR